MGAIGRATGSFSCRAWPGWWLFFAVPLAIIFVVSLGTRDQFGGVILDNLGLSNYRRALEPDFLPTVTNSLRYATLTTIFSIVIAYPIAYWISRYGGRRKVLLLILVMLPFWTSWVIRTYAWMIILGDSGVLNGVLGNLGFIDEPIVLLNTDLAVVLGMTYGFLPFAILPLYVSIDRLDPALVAAARDLYAGGRARVLARHLAPDDARHHRRRDAHVHSCDRRLRHAGPARRRPDHHDRQGHPDAVPVERGLAIRGRPRVPADRGHDRGNGAGRCAILRREVIG